MNGEDELGFSLAKVAAKHSTCIRRQVGALLYARYPTGSMGYTVGFNVERSGLRCDKGQCPRGLKSLEEQPAYAPYDDCVAIHAEVMVLSNFLPSQTRGCTLYVTEQPCSECQALIDRHEGLEVKVLPKGE